uniref:G-protein coupled receptors family 1 profile domain-containing protein n=1 Tax=Gasterosteus aculeatus aculeatus TaxID=481459 RepID=A0AAQ4QTM7_GASAC
TLLSSYQLLLQEGCASSLCIYVHLYFIILHLSAHCDSQPAGHHLHLPLQAAPHLHQPPPPLSGRLRLLRGPHRVLSNSPYRWLLVSSVLLKDNLEEPGRYNSCFGECVIVINYIAGRADLFFTFIGPVTVIIVLYMRVFVVAVTQARVMRSHVSMNITAKKSEMKAARTLGVVIVVFLLCLCPYYCVALSGQDTLLDASSATIVICVFYFNSCLNPLIYAFFYPWFRRSMKLIVTLEILQPGSCERNLL